MTNLTHAHMNEIGFPFILESSVMQILSSLILRRGGGNWYMKVDIIFIKKTSLLSEYIYALQIRFKSFDRASNTMHIGVIAR